MSSDFLFTSESVSEGHPDKLADQISDAIVDAAYSASSDADRSTVRCACETLLKGDLLALAGEMRLPEGVELDYLAIAEKVIREIGYGDADSGMDLASAQRVNAISAQSADISVGVDASGAKKLGAGDQGLMFGYACSEDPDSLMPLPIIIAHELVRRQAQFRRTEAGACLGPDAKSQVTVRYVDRKPVAIDSIVLSTQHAAELDGREVVVGDERMYDLVRDEIINPVIAKHSELQKADPKTHINPTGKFIVGGPQGDAGLTGRKIIVDTYGGAAPHGGGAFSGKDPTKVDRSAAYAARNVAKNVVAAGLAARCLVQLSYAIGVAEPVSIAVDTFGTAVGIDEAGIAARIKDVYDLTPGGIIEQFDLFRPIYRQVAAYGHMGRADLDLPWEKLTKVEQLKDGLQAIQAS